MFKNLLKPDNALMITMTWITDCIFLSLFWLLGCFPVVTVGASFAALYDASYRAFRKGEKNSWQRFARVYRENWKAGIGPSIVLIAVTFGLSKVLIGLWNAAVAGTLPWMVFSGGAFVGVLLFGMLSIMCPMLSRFDNSFSLLLKNTALLGPAHLPRTLALGMVNTATALVCIRYVIPIVFLPALAALIGSWLIEPMFRPYMPQETEEPTGEVIEEPIEEAAE